MKAYMAAALALWAAPTLAEVAGYYPTLGDTVITSNGTPTGAQIATWYGAPDDVYTGIGSRTVTYDFGGMRIFNGAGQDLNVYEVDTGSPEFSILQVLVSANGSDFFNISPSIAAAVDLVGDNVHSNASFRRSYDVGAAVAALGASEFRYLRLTGTAGGNIGGSNGFDLEAVGLVNFREAIAPPPPGGVPEPATWAMLIAGFGLVGAAARRRRPVSVSG